MSQNPKTETQKASPWWKFGHVWLIIAGPLIVVIAGFVTLYLAVRSPDPVITPDYYRKGLELSQQAPASAAAGSLAPAVQARNHAATGVPPPPKADVPR